ncbi:uncharacterized protein LOC122065639 [Macadamia integrifolia]|uniref:uncharacterized protein LOC122065639 n=1 Tax=Macadamia integrifolia TaxID=60698 RepID=UPI001C4FE88C|nr:uncharacterized protein LOC122065639 [Macadamia integrifolia]
MLCLKPPTKDDCLSKWDNSVVPFPNLDNNGDEPKSPRVGCMGQIKRDRRVIGFPIHNRCNNRRSTNSDKKYFKLNKVFSGKNLNSFLGMNLSSTRNSNYSKKEMIKGASRIKSYDEMDYVSISVVDLDPPLPVIKPGPRISTDGGDAVCLWKRRCGGDQTLKALQLQQRNPSSVLGPTTL